MNSLVSMLPSCQFLQRSSKFLLAQDFPTFRRLFLCSLCTCVCTGDHLRRAKKFMSVHELADGLN